MKRTFEIDDCLQECMDGAIECMDGAIDQVRDALESYLLSNPDTDETPDLNDLDFSGAIHEIIDGSVPIYTKQIDAIFYLYGSEVEAAFENAGIGEKEDEGWPCGWRAAAIYCYIEQKVAEWYQANAEDIFEAWKEKRDVKAAEVAG